MKNVNMLVNPEQRNYYRDIIYKNKVKFHGVVSIMSSVVLACKIFQTLEHGSVKKQPPKYTYF